MSHTPKDDLGSRRVFGVRTRTGRLLAATLATTVAVGGVALANGPSAGAAAAPISQSAGRFLSGTISTTNLDTIAGIQGEAAVNPGNAGPNANSLNATALKGAIRIPLAQGLQLPDPSGGAIQLGAVSQYAAANSDGSALGASGAIDSNGGIGVAGSNGVPTGGATIDLSGSKLLSSITSEIADLKLSIGAVSARAQQVKFGSTIADPSASCSNKSSTPYRRISGPDQAGTYKIAGLSIDLNSALLKTVGTTLTNAVTTAINAIEPALKLLGTVVMISNVPTAADVLGSLTVKIGNGAVVVNLLDGSVHIDLAKLLAYLGYDLNTLCPNTSLLPYLVQGLQAAVTQIGTIVADIATNLTTAIGKIGVSVAGIPLPTSKIVMALASVVTTLTTALGPVVTTLTTALQPVFDALNSNVVVLLANAQDESGGTFIETALVAKVLPTANLAQVNLALAAVGPSTPRAAPSTTPATPTPAGKHAPTDLPTGVPAGLAQPSGTPTAPIVLLLVGLLMAGAGAVAWKVRGRHS